MILFNSHHGMIPSTRDHQSMHSELQNSNTTTMKSKIRRSKDISDPIDCSPSATIPHVPVLYSAFVSPNAIGSLVSVHQQPRGLISINGSRHSWRKGTAIGITTANKHLVGTNTGGGKTRIYYVPCMTVKKLATKVVTVPDTDAENVSLDVNVGLASRGSSMIEDMYTHTHAHVHAFTPTTPAPASSATTTTKSKSTKSNKSSYSSTTEDPPTPLAPSAISPPKSPVPPQTQAEENASRKTVEEEASRKIAEDVKLRRRRGGPQKGRVVSDETRRRISASMTGKVKSDDLKAKISAKLQGRVPWNKGKKLSPETRARMSEARYGKSAWNRGSRLSQDHKSKIADAMASRLVSPETRRKLQIARRRPIDPVLMSFSTSKSKGDFPLLDTKDIHVFVMLRRELQSWSNDFLTRVGRRPTMTDIRRLASIELIRKFERYTKLRENIRGLAVDVYGQALNLDSIRAEAPGQSTPRSDRNVRTIQVRRGARVAGGDVTIGDSGSAAISERSQQPPIYGYGTPGSTGWADHGVTAPQSPPNSYGHLAFPTSGSNSSTFGIGYSSHAFPASREYVSTTPARGDKYQPSNTNLSINDFRELGKYRLLESCEINKLIQLRRQVQPWLDSFALKNGRRAALADVNAVDFLDSATSDEDKVLHEQVVKYLELRESTKGLLSDVLRIDPDDPVALEQLSQKGEELLKSLRRGSSEQINDAIRPIG